MLTAVATATRRLARLRLLVSGEASATERILYFAAFVVLVCARLPVVTLQGRLWAEEGWLFLWFGAWWPWYKALLVIWGGYLNIVANAAGVLSWHLVPVEQIPRVTFAVALVFQSCPAILLLTGRDSWLRPRAGLIAALLVLVLAPFAEEVWLNTIHAQFELALCAALILALELRGGAVGAFRLLLLALGPLSGPATVLVLPLFGLRALVERSAGRIVQACVLAAAAAIQLGVFYTPLSGRSFGFAPPLLLDTLFSHLVLPPLVPADMATDLGVWMRGHLDTPAMRVWLPLATLGIAAAAAALVVWMRRTAALWLMAAAGVLGVISRPGLRLSGFRRPLHLRAPGASRLGVRRAGCRGAAALGAAGGGARRLAHRGWRRGLLSADPRLRARPRLAAGGCRVAARSGAPVPHLAGRGPLAPEPPAAGQPPRPRPPPLRAGVVRRCCMDRRSWSCCRPTMPSAPSAGPTRRSRTRSSTTSSSPTTPAPTQPSPPLANSASTRCFTSAIAAMAPTGRPATPPPLAGVPTSS